MDSVRERCVVYVQTSKDLRLDATFRLNARLSPHLLNTRRRASLKASLARARKCRIFGNTMWPQFSQIWRPFCNTLILFQLGADDTVRTKGQIFLAKAHPCVPPVSMQDHTAKRPPLSGSRPPM